MKRSQINAAIDLAHKALAQHGIRLPKYALLDARRLERAGPEMSRVTRNALGWACTDFGQGDFEQYRHHDVRRAQRHAGGARRKARRTARRSSC